MTNYASDGITITSELLCGDRQTYNGSLLVTKKSERNSQGVLVVLEETVYVPGTTIIQSSAKRNIQGNVTGQWERLLQDANYLMQTVDITYAADGVTVKSEVRRNASTLEMISKKYEPNSAGASVAVEETVSKLVRTIGFLAQLYYAEIKQSKVERYLSGNTKSITEYDSNGNFIKVTRYDEKGNVIP